MSLISKKTNCYNCSGEMLHTKTDDYANFMECNKCGALSLTDFSGVVIWQFEGKEFLPYQPGNEGKFHKAKKGD